MTKTLEKLESDLDYYRKIYAIGKKDHHLRKMEGAQWNIDRTYDEIHKLKKG